MASILGKFTKTEIERKQYTIDYANWLGEDEVLLGVETLITLMNPDEITETIPLIVDVVVINADQASCTMIVDDGTEGGEYVISLYASTTITQLKEDGLQITITPGVNE